MSGNWYPSTQKSRLIQVGFNNLVLLIIIEVISVFSNMVITSLQPKHMSFKRIKIRLLSPGASSHCVEN